MHLDVCVGLDRLFANVVTHGLSFEVPEDWISLPVQFVKLSACLSSATVGCLPGSRRTRLDETGFLRHSSLQETFEFPLKVGHSLRRAADSASLRSLDLP